MGSCVLDLSKLDVERTHDIWTRLENNFGLLHLSVTMSNIHNDEDKENECTTPVNDATEKYVWHNLKSDWSDVGQLFVKVISVKGFSSNNFYCILEHEIQRFHTPNIRSSSEWTKNKNYIFNICDITSTLDIKVNDSSLVNSLMNDSLGRISIPLLKIKNGEMRWYALKDSSKRQNAKGNCPRILLQMSVVWNPVKATANLLRPKKKKVKWTPPFHMGLVYSNLEFIKETFDHLHRVNENLKALFEWEEWRTSFAALVVWLLFWYFFEVWAAPLLLMLPFVYNCIYYRYNPTECDKIEESVDSRRLSKRLKNLPEMTITIASSIEYMVLTAERANNLVSFKMPFLSYLTMLFLASLSVYLYTIPLKYLLMALGIYKFTRKFLNPDRILNNDLLDFISRVPDNATLKDWEELSVPEPNQPEHHQQTQQEEERHQQNSVPQQQLKSHHPKNE